MATSTLQTQALETLATVASEEYFRQTYLRNLCKPPAIKPLPKQPLPKQPLPKQPLPQRQRPRQTPKQKVPQQPLSKQSPMASRPLYRQWFETPFYAALLEGRLTGELRCFDPKLCPPPIVYTDDKSNPQSVLIRWDSLLAPFWLEAHINLQHLHLSVIRGKGVPRDATPSVVSSDMFPQLLWPTTWLRWDSVSCPSFWLSTSFGQSLCL